MGFRPQVFFQAFQRAGLLVQATHLPASPTPTDFAAHWLRPDRLLLADEAQTVDYEIEYQTADAPAIRRGDPLRVDGKDYVARSAPRATGDGYFSHLMLDAA
ncbi:MAG TPA: hypothetical protein PLN55_11510 [Burkholderiaceae bacterium]|nr:hypothetical protein [Burkholderiaceae bacterium]